jgi:uncharacterized protein YbaR (Trm112 family)
MLTCVVDAPLVVKLADSKQTDGEEPVCVLLRAQCLYCSALNVCFSIDDSIPTHMDAVYVPMPQRIPSGGGDSTTQFGHVVTYPVYRRCIHKPLYRNVVCESVCTVYTCRYHV